LDESGTAALSWSNAPSRHRIATHLATLCREDSRTFENVKLIALAVDSLQITTV
jgi:hypothetical protein